MAADGISRESPNSRLNAIRKFLGACPPDARRLRLLVNDTPPLPLGEWVPLADQRDVLAEEIESLLIEHASEHRRYKMAYLLAWCAEDGSTKTVKQLTVYGHQLRESGGGTPEDTVRDLDGTALSQVSQAQRHLEAMMRMHMGNSWQIINLLSSTVERLTERLAQTETSQSVKHDELLTAKETILGLLNEAASDQLTPAQAKALELAEKLIPSLAVWLHAQAAAKKPPAAAAAPPNGKATA